MAPNDLPIPATAAALAIARYNRRLGLVLFAIYFVVYAGFVVLIAANFNAGGAPTPFGVNLAIVYGLGLIVGAMVIAVIYMAFARNETV